MMMVMIKRWLRAVRRRLKRMLIYKLCYNLGTYEDGGDIIMLDTIGTAFYGDPNADLPSHGWTELDRLHAHPKDIPSIIQHTIARITIARFCWLHDFSDTCYGELITMQTNYPFCRYLEHVVTLLPVSDSYIRWIDYNQHLILDTSSARFLSRLFRVKK